jgi:ribokinase
MTPPVVVVGSINADITLLVERLPERGETVLTSAPAQLSFGGKGGNQAAAAAAFGGSVAMIGTVGDDDIGRRACADLDERGVDVTHVRVAEGIRTGSASIAVEPAGENMIVVDPGANACLTPGDIDPDSLAHAAIVLVQLEVPPETVAAVVRAAGPKVVLNPAPARPLAANVLGPVGVLVVNVPELVALTGAQPPAEPDAIVPLARGLHSNVVVTLGARGALVVPAVGPPVHVPAPHAQIRDATGAGDCFCGALAVLLAEGAELAQAARLAVAAATLSATAVGARGMLPGRAEAATLAHGLSVRVLDGDCRTQSIP